MSAEPDDPSIAPSLVEDVALRLQRQVGLVPSKGLGVVRRAIFFALLTWLPLVVWAFYRGRILAGGGVSEPLVMHFGIHARFLIAVPALILGEAMAHRLSTTLIPYFLTSGVVPPEQRGAFVRVVSSVARLRDRALPWVAIFVVVALWTIFQPAVGAEAEHEALWASTAEVGGLGFGGWWFLYVSRPIFSVLLIAWLWRLALLFILLKRIAGLELSIVPTHPDGSGGLGFVKDMPKAFSLVAFATSAVVASRLAHDVIYHDASLMSLKAVLATFVVLVVVVCIAPLFALVRPLAAAKRRALLEYGALVGAHGRRVRQRWILKQDPADDGLLQAPEIGPVADTLALYDAVRKMKPVPFSKSTLFSIAVPTIIPIIFLLSTRVPIKEVLKKILGALL